MNDAYKVQRLRSYKRLATGLFLLMLAVYVFAAWLTTTYTAGWIGFVKAFAEAAMVGALADWFAVTALFHHPLGLPIPHTNLIENSKKTIGDNLGNFVVTNFLNAANIRPYIKKINVSAYTVQWLSKEKNKQILITEIARLLNDIMSKINDESIIRFITNKGRDLINNAKLHTMVADALDYFLDKKEHEKLITILAEKIKQYIMENEEMVKEKVRKESLFFIPKFIDNKLAQKIGNGLINYFDEIEHNATHKIRADITTQLQQFTASLRNDAKWEQEFLQLKTNILSEEKLDVYAKDLWASLKNILQQELANNNSALINYFSKNLDELVYNLQTDNALQQRIDKWVHFNAYKYILKNAGKVSALISDTVGNWQGKELSRKLELEVGKDLQFIRINGTIVGGLVGLLIHTLTTVFF